MTEKKTAFTLIELLIVIGIIALLAALLLPALSKAAETARGIGCIHKIKQVNLLCSFYSGDNCGFELPVSLSEDLYGNGCAWKEYISVNYIPRLNDPALANKYFICPSDSDPAKNYYIRSSKSSYGYTTRLGNLRDYYTYMRTDRVAEALSPYKAPVKTSQIKKPSSMLRLGECKIGDGIFTLGTSNLSVFFYWQIEHYKASFICYFVHNGRANIGYMDGSCRSGNRIDLSSQQIWKEMKNE